jgi:uncharacterized protein (TIGR02597 family)
MASPQILPFSPASKKQSGRGRFARFVLGCAGVVIAMTASAHATTSVSESAGVLKITIPPPAPGSTSRRALGVPFHRPAEYQGIVLAIGSDTVTFSNALFGAGQFTTTPHFARILGGLNVGRYFLITSHTTTAVTVDTAGTNLTSLLQPGNNIEIFPAHTLGSLFGTATVPFQTGATEASADLVRLTDGLKWVSYFHDGANWRTTGNASSQNNVLVRPEQGMFIVCKGPNPVELTFTGEISTTRESSALPGIDEILLSPRFPVQITLADLRIHLVAGWSAGDTAAVADNVMLWNGTAWDIHYYTGSTWLRAGSYGAQDNTPISPGAALLIHRRSGTSGPASLLINDPPFIYP